MNLKNSPYPSTSTCPWTDFEAVSGLAQGWLTAGEMKSKDGKNRGESPHNVVLATLL